MRRALIAILMGATMVTPVAAAAQESEEGGLVRQARRAQDRDDRQERRQERQEQRSESGAERQEQRVERRRERPAEASERRSEGFGEFVRDRVQQENRREREDRREDRRDTRNDRREDRADRRDDRRDVRQDWRRDRREDRAESRRWNRAWRQDRRYDWQRWRYANRSLFSVGRYYSPFRNYGYSRFSIGLRIGSPFYSSRYWINDPWQYRLPPAYAGTRWVRYYDDVLLVDLYTGEVIDVIYDFFW